MSSPVTLSSDFKLENVSFKEPKKNAVGGTSVLLSYFNDVTKKSGIYLYIFTRDEKYLNIRTFTDNQKREAYEKQQGICIHCGEHFDIDEMEADHITPWSKGGKTTSENCQMLCLDCNRRKSDK